MSFSRQLLIAFLGLSGASLFSSIEIKFGGTRLRPFDLMMVLNTIGFLMSFGLPGWRRLGPIRWVLSLFLVAYGIRAMSGILQSEYITGFIELIQAVEFSIFALSVGLACSTLRGRELFMWSFVGFTTAIGLAGLGIAASKGQIASLKLLDEPKYTYGIIFLFAIVRYVFAERHRILWGMTLVCLAPLLIISGERNAWLGIAAALGFLTIKGGAVARGHLRQLLVSIATCGVIFAVSFWIVAKFNEYAARQWSRLVEPIYYLDTWSGGLDYMAAESPSNRARLLQLQNLTDIVSSDPWFGLGTGQYYAYASSGAFTEDNAYIATMHGEYWQLLVENGVFAFGFYCLTWVALFRVGLGLAPSCPPDLWRAMGMAMSFCVYGAVTNAFVGGGSVNFILLFLPIGLTLGVWIEVQNRFRGGQGMERRQPRVGASGLSRRLTRQ